MRTLLISLTILTCLPVQAQTAEDSVKAVVNSLFTAMKNADAEMMKSVMAADAVLQTVSKNKEGQVMVAGENMADFISSVSKLPKGAADERITFDVVKIDGALALAWTPYQFYYNGKFSHCGVNSFQLVRFTDGWKIQYIIDTRRKGGCGE
ncbi:MAG TPA: nuclear transport factor 2 family protein [Chitinophagaceae bacterium]|nr:nuclear transport factor 2 family protein [Chitinophagaceae bacterium]